MIGVIVPAHNEAAHLPGCVASILQAANHPDLAGEAVHIVVVLDACSDGSREAISGMSINIIEIHAMNVGQARATGANVAILAGARWLAFTDADSRVPPNWLAAQLHARSDAFCGTVQVDDWRYHSETVQQRYASAYHFRDGHPHVHGANLGVCTKAYLLAGGFPSMVSNEDVVLVDKLVQMGANVARLATPCVTTSARRVGRAPAGFAGFLRSLEEVSP